MIKTQKENLKISQLNSQITKTYMKKSAKLLDKIGEFIS